MNKIAVIAGGGNLPAKLKNHLQNIKREFFVIAVKGEAESNLVDNIDHIWINPGELGKALNVMEKQKVKQVVFAGSIKKPNLITLKVDAVGAKFLARVVKSRFLGDDTILSTLTRFLEEKGFAVIGAHQLLDDLTVQARNFTSLWPDEQDNIDIELGRNVAKVIGSLDIGQAVVVENGVVLAVEAIEGTDNMLQRVKYLKRSSKKAGIMIKLVKPNQDLRMDLPTIGINTIKNAQEANLKGIVIQAEKTIFLDQEEVINFANQHQMFVCSQYFDNK